MLEIVDGFHPVWGFLLLACGVGFNQADAIRFFCEGGWRLSFCSFAMCPGGSHFYFPRRLAFFIPPGGFRFYFPRWLSFLFPPAVFIFISPVGLLFVFPPAAFYFDFPGGFLFYFPGGFHFYFCRRLALSPGDFRFTPPATSAFPR